VTALHEPHLHVRVLQRTDGQVGSATELGGNSIDLSSLEPLKLTALHIPLVHSELGNHGMLTVQVIFQPESKLLSIAFHYADDENGINP
jgi:hypothetical protein